MPRYAVAVTFDAPDGDHAMSIAEAFAEAYQYYAGYFAGTYPTFPRVEMDTSHSDQEIDG